MSDFLDRVAARVIDGEAAMLSPRVPSMYEAGQGMASAPMEQSLSVIAEAARSVDDRPGEPPRAQPGQVSPKAAPSLASSDAAGKQTHRAEPTMPRAPGHSLEPAKHPELPAFARHRLIEPIASHVVAQAQAPSSFRSQSEQPAATRQAAVPDAAVGVLLPPQQPVFGAPLPDAKKHAAHERHRAAAMLMQGELREPVVHVSIGRIEVRAAAASAPAARRQDKAPADRLGDYLRERNKASP